MRAIRAAQCVNEAACVRFPRLPSSEKVEVFGGGPEMISDIFFVYMVVLGICAQNIS